MSMAYRNDGQVRVGLCLKDEGHGRGKSPALQIEGDDYRHLKDRAGHVWGKKPSPQTVGNDY